VGSENTTAQSSGALSQEKPWSCLSEYFSNNKKWTGKKFGTYSVYMYPGLIELTRIFFGPSSQAKERAI
jgi:hypothetical protein